MPDATNVIDIRGLTEVKTMLAGLKDELPKVNQSSQNKLAYEIMAAEKEQMKADLDRPTPWSVGSLRYKKVGVRPVGAPDVPGAAVYFETPWGYSSGLGADEWLGVQILGGETAGPKRSESRLQMLGYMPRGTVWVPAAETKLDQYGNVPGSAISAMLSDLGANPYGRSGDPGAKEAKFVLVGEPGREEGVWRKVRGQWQPFLWFVPRQQYRPRYRFHERAEAAMREKWKSIFGYYLDRALQQQRA